MILDPRRDKRDPLVHGLAVLALALLSAPAPPVADEPAAEWRYVVPPEGDPFEHPPLRALPLSATKPADVIEDAHYRGSRRRYTQLRYGSPTSVRVTVVLDEIGPREADLYVDLRRQRRITTADRINGRDLTWRVPLDMAQVKGIALTTLPRTVIFRLGPVARTLSFATAGYLEGTVQVGDKRHRARRTDGDGNGLFNDWQDRIWIDLNDDGNWDAAEEQFLYSPILTLGGTRYAVRSDELGRDLTMKPLEGTGTVRLAVKPARPARVTDLAAALVGRDGSAISLHGPSAQAVVPQGEYRLSAVTIVLDDPKGGLPWTFVFSDSGGRVFKRWYRVAKGGSLTIDPIGKLELRTGLGDAVDGQPGKDLEFQPRLYTGDGLLIVTCVRGSLTATAEKESAWAEMDLVGPDGKSLSATRSGFA